MRAEFEEKQYEVPACIELGAGKLGSRVFSSGQVLEKILGYDVAAGVDSNHLIWRVLRAPRPAGVALIPKYWSPLDTPDSRTLPISPVNLILQFKRPESMIHGTAAQWGLWRAPYFRFSRTPHQHRILAHIESQLGGSALVRYAAPAFATRGELEAAQLTGEVLSRSGFVSPSTLGAHRIWTYQRPGLAGRGNPSGHRRPFETSDELSERIASSTANIDGSTNVIATPSIPNLAAAARYRNPRSRSAVDLWVDVLAKRDLGLSDRQLLELRDYASVQTALALVGAHWWLSA